MPTALWCRKIFKYKLGIRYGTDIAGAAYGMSDFGDEFPQKTAREQFIFLLNPPPGNWADEWDNHYYNTLLHIKGQADSGSILLVTLAGANGERYHAGPPALGDKHTFRKCPRLQPNSEILGEMPYGHDDTISFMNTWIEHMIDDEIPDPGNNFL